MKKTLAFAVACLFATALSVHADTWFNANIDKYDAWPNPTIGPTGGAWTDGAAGVAKLVENRLVLTNNVDSLEFSATDSIDISKTQTVFQTTVVFTPYDLGDPPPIPVSAKGGMIVVEEAEDAYAYYGLAKDAETNVWTKLEALGAASVTNDVTLTVTIFGGKIKYTIGEVATDWLEIASNDDLIKYASYQGAGEIAELSATYESMVASITFPDMTDKNIASVTANGEEVPLAGGALHFLKGTDVTVVYTALTGHCFTNGLATISYAGVLSENATIDAESLPVAEKVGDLAGSGTEGDPYIIATEADLVILRKGTSSGKYGLAGQFFKQTADIALVTEWVGIGNSTTPFCGNYDGDNHAITDIRLRRLDDNGLFGYLSGATMKNINLTFLGLSTTDSKPDSFMIGGLAACAYDSTNINVTVNGSIGDETNPVTHNLAGICAFVKGNTELVACTNNATLYGIYTKTCGIVAYCADTTSHTLFDRCANNGIVTAANEKTSGDTTIVGAMIGYAPQPVTIRDCASLGAIYASNQVKPEMINCGSFIGTMSTVTFEGTLTFRASLKPVGNAIITALTYATVDGEGIATAVAGMTPEVGGTYILYAPVGEGTLCTFTTREDTLAVNTNGYSFAGTVEIDPALENAKLVTVTNDQTVTFSVASTYEAMVNDVSYPTLADAFNDAGEGDTVSALVSVEIEDPISIEASIFAISNDAVVVLNGIAAENALAVTGSGTLSLAGECNFAADIDLSALAAAQFVHAENEFGIGLGENTLTLPSDFEDVETFLTNYVSGVEGAKAICGTDSWTYDGSTWTQDSPSVEPAVPGVPREFDHEPSDVEMAAIPVALDQEQAAMSAEDQAIYQSLFEPVKRQGEGGVWTVTLEPTQEALATVSEEIEPTTTNLVSVVGQAKDVSVKTQPGLYYSVGYGDAITLGNETERTLGTGGTLNISIPAIEGAKGFYQMRVNVKKSN